MENKHFEVIVIGSGPGGYIAAIRSSQLGLRTALVERESLGGVCLNWGCIPTKAMLRSAEVYHLMGRADEFGLKTQKIGFDLDKVVGRSRGIANQLSGGVKHLLKKNKVTVIEGEASLPAIGKVSVKNKGESQELTADNIILATGARAREIPGLETDGELVWSYKDALVPSRMPKKLLVIGSGAIGVEFASFYSTLGSEITIVEAMGRFLPNEDSEISASAESIFKKRGMTVLTDTTVQKLIRKDKHVVAHIEHKGSVQEHEFDTVISAVGVVGNVENLGLEALGVRVEGTHVVVDEKCRTGVEGLFAIGDVAGAPCLAHKASHEGIMVAEYIAGKEVKPIKAVDIPRGTYCKPQIASVGITEEKARELGHDITVGRFPFIGNGKAIAMGESEGFTKTIYDKQTGELLGAHMIGMDVTELIHGFVIGRKLEATEQELMTSIFPHPTLSESMQESVLSAFDRALHI